MIAMQDDAEHEIAYLRHGTERPLSGEEYDTRSIEWFRRHKEVYESVASACRTNEIIASQRVVDTCNAILVSNRNYLTEFDERLKALVDPASPSQFKEVIIGFDDFHPPNIPNELKNLTNEDLRDKFVDAARSDLGATD